MEGPRARRRRRRGRGERNFFGRLIGYFVVCPFDPSLSFSFFLIFFRALVLFISFSFALLAWLVWSCVASFVNPLFVWCHFFSRLINFCRQLIYFVGVNTGWEGRIP